MALAAHDTAKAIFRGMDRATLDAAYNNSAAVADSPQWLAQWQRRSADRRAGPGVRLDLAYGDKERTSLDYFSAGESGAPLLVFLHGGYWQRNAKEMFSFVAEGPNARGIDVAVVGYTLAPAARLSQIADEIDQALAFLIADTEQFGFDRRRLVVGGWSAGGQLASLASTRSSVRGALCISGIFDLEPIALCYLNDLLRLDRREIAELSPLRLVHVGAAPQCLAVGGDELPELRRQTADYAELACAVGSPITARILAGHHHFSMLDELSADGALTGELLRLVGA
ncbi:MULTISPECIES: alpha/beta hydrolase [Rhodopseudomonas]|uniref:Alpha/beta hydrolase n=1 Tax=Rhodopseudomonas palustris TaxID=1076 RepID=A0A0D7EY00_RHOPL|nr:MULTISPECIES: alpha/beta hydrolase [Rhodopseudomonas]KIZ45506.1 alpha/beta hydrolase [Rhodopseudomonas palustris]MDF3814441.1 alpha/beta hydrolase [Rhodopseudomonas sp. BAL398]WOK18895.1 alpha/beta hydrolase [Rhodopseudomonas sp. BAL398]